MKWLLEGKTYEHKLWMEGVNKYALHTTKSIQTHTLLTHIESQMHILLK